MSRPHRGPDGSCDCDGLGADIAGVGPWSWTCEAKTDGQNCDICQAGNGQHCRAGDWQPSDRELYALQAEALAAGDESMADLCEVAVSMPSDRGDQHWLDALAACRAAILCAAARAAEDM